jgi:hypothetical protein
MIGLIETCSVRKINNKYMLCQTEYAVLYVMTFKINIRVVYCRKHGVNTHIHGNMHCDPANTRINK